MRTLDSAIAHERVKTIRYRILADSDELVQKSYDAHFDKLKYKKCAEEHEQFAEWLEELKCYKNDNDFSEYADRLHKVAFTSGYNKAIDDFVNTVKAKFPSDKNGICNIEIIAEQLKEGGENDKKRV